MKKAILFSLAILMSIIGSAQTTSVLFLGNSYTQGNNLPQRFHDLSLAAGDSVYFDSNTPGGHTLEGHSGNATSISKIYERDWDFVVLQEQSQRPSFPPFQVESDVYPYAEILCDTIRANHACTEPVFYMTWGRRSGDQQNCQFYEPLCTFEGMSTRLRASYLEMAQDNDARVAPCGAAWSALDIADTTFFAALYSGDGSHTSTYGQYLNACVFYATIFKKSPVGIPYYANISEEDAGTLQQLAHDIVIDSLDTWNINVNFPTVVADHSEVGATSIQFAQSSVGATEHFWDFGDGNTSTDLAPLHDYGMSSMTYDVTYVATDECGRSDTSEFSVTTGPNSINDDELEFIVQSYGNGLYRIQADGHQFSARLENLDGRLIKEYSVIGSADVNLSDQPTGIYLLTLVDKEGERKVLKLTR